MFTRFDRQTYGRTDTAWRHRPRLCIASRFVRQKPCIEQQLVEVAAASRQTTKILSRTTKTGLTHTHTHIAAINNCSPQNNVQFTSNEKHQTHENRNFNFTNLIIKRHFDPICMYIIFITTNAKNCNFGLCSTSLLL